jgi:hypothetical protein
MAGRFENQGIPENRSRRKKQSGILVICREACRDTN